jgi:hypothetical protein
VGWACGTHGRGEKCVKGFGGKARRKKDHLKDQGVDGMVGSKWILWILVGGGGGVDSPGSGWGPLAGCCECGDEPSGSGATELVSLYLNSILC